jgi:hypothetical protein
MWRSCGTRPFPAADLRSVSRGRGSALPAAAVTDTDEARFQAYVDGLGIWLARAWKNRLGKNLFYALASGKRRVYASFFPGKARPALWRMT